MCCLTRCLLLLLLVAVAFLPAASANAQPAPGDVVVNELLYDPPSDQDAGEYVELLNRSEETVDLSRLALADSRGELTAPVAAAVGRRVEEARRRTDQALEVQKL